MHKKAIIAMALTGALGVGGTGVAQAQQAEEPEFVGTPSVRYVKVPGQYYSLGAVVRLDREVEPNQTAYTVAPDLKSGQEIGSVFGGDPGSSIGADSRHCYTVELQRPRPASTPRDGARWRLGVRQSNTVLDTVSVTLKRSEGDDWLRRAAERLGCYASSDAGDDDGGEGDSLVGQRVPVRVDQLLLYEDPAKSYVGSLLKGQTFKVRRLSPSGKYAYGFAYGGANKTGWVLASGLEQE